MDRLDTDASRSIVAPYCCAPLDGPPVATPLDWEVDAALHAAPERLTFTAADLRARLEGVGNPLSAVLDLRQSLPRAPSILD